jgi:phosphoribosylamine---glycine ligase
MKILVIGSGGREHALVWKLRQSRGVEQVWCAPGNGGISQHAECVAAESETPAGWAALAKTLGADLTVVGPEGPLVAGIADEFAAQEMKIVGPGKQAAQLEGSKVFAKEFMERHGIPTAPLYGVYDSPGDAYAALCAVDWPMVIKADGLCAGKGVLVAPTPDDATAFIGRLMEEREFGEGGDKVLMEEALTGQELSYIVLTDGQSVLPLLPTRDHKRAFDGNKGPNTGGMGAYSSDDLLPAELETRIRTEIVEPAIRGMAADGNPYRGFLYFGLMLTADGPKVLEYNCRLGDPETQPIMVRADFDLAEALHAAAEGQLASFKATWKPGASVCVVVASGGYPGKYETGKEIGGLSEADSDVVVFHAGTRREGDIYYTSSGRVLGLTAAGKDLAAAAEAAYAAVGKIRFQGAHFRTDIGASAGKSAATGD